MPQAAIAAGHRETAQAAADILGEGGTAVDAALAGLLASCVAEPVLSSLGGGGFLLVRPAEGRPVVYDFFAQTPRRKRPEGEIAIEQIRADFGTATQPFWIGPGTIAAPGVVSGVFAAHADHGRVPITMVAEPASRLARTGVPFSDFQAHVSTIVAPIVLATPESRALFADPKDPEKPLPSGAVFTSPAMADVIESVAAEGPRLFYEGEIAAAIAEACLAKGGHLTREDLAAYETVRRQPLETSFGAIKLQTNPPPAAGGSLVAFALSLLDGRDFGKERFLGAEHAASIAQAMLLTDRARLETGSDRDMAAMAEALVKPSLLQHYKRTMTSHSVMTRGTTHLSVVDRDGTAATLTVSNGEGCGWVDPDVGFMLNNMLGEEELQPGGIGSWVPDSRLSSMTAPTVAETRDGALTALGSGGSSRIRTAILQVLINRFGFGKPLDAAVEAPRLHVEGGRADIEPGFDEEAADAVGALHLDCVRWDQQNMFFGGVHAVERLPNGSVTAAADPRRDGAALIV